jgi:flagellar motor switch protein FliG
MDFLGDIDDEVLTRVIAGEHPQAIALVLASIPPAQAARIVTTLEPSLQSESLNRIARLDDASSEAMADFAEHLRAKVERYGARSNASGGSPGGKNALQAILDAMPQVDGPNQQARDNPNSERLRSEYRTATEHAAKVDEVLKPRETSEQIPATTDHQSNHLGSSSITDHDATISDETHQTLSPQLTTVDVNPFDSTDAIHQHLIQLSPQQLCQTLAEVETRQALLTLCGLPNHVAEKVLSALPRSQAKQVRARLGSLGNLQLREIDEAKEWVALVSIGWSPTGSRHALNTHSAVSDASTTIPVAA